ncbi:hypothetical protein M427DRAFT_132734 [Gonapodya prolifera JEL478]|uniref:Uncharacterized protein n=1 Tax=Gonapodya prolifera (strain JEL478) TaxID=1344416 RepID=A0A139ANQ4_GONPJ|nr:hypothetical protein M427DRAFT_132734 [Gonapodya prolifera JEL478]|eukprot:KXS18370.1 hypothetical protein M427DRAFT_132734 [Gonapodya prolifera JEL478]
MCSEKLCPATPPPALSSCAFSRHSATVFRQPPPGPHPTPALRHRFPTLGASGCNISIGTIFSRPLHLRTRQ